MITITISGNTGTGKSFMFFIIKELLRAYGFKNLKLELSNDFINESDLDKHVKNKMSVSSFLEKEIILKEVQTNRSV